MAAVYVVESDRSGFFTNEGPLFLSQDLATRYILKIFEKFKNNTWTYRNVLLTSSKPGAYSLTYEMTDEIPGHCRRYGFDLQIAEAGTIATSEREIDTAASIF